MEPYGASSVVASATVFSGYLPVTLAVAGYNAITHKPMMSCIQLNRLDMPSIIMHIHYPKCSIVGKHFLPWFCERYSENYTGEVWWENFCCLLFSVSAARI